MAHWWKSGEWNAVCDVCGFERKSGQLKERWDGLMVCDPIVQIGCWEPRHPQDFIRPVRDQEPLPWTRPETIDEFIPGDVCTLEARQSVADYCVANCWIAGIDFGIRPEL